MNKTPVRVMIVDDSALIRQLLTGLLSQDPEIEVVGVAPDPVFALQKLDSLRPDVLTLDVEMPRMDGLSFLRELMRTRPLPVLMVSSLTERGAEVTLEALSLGAVDFVAKPKLNIAQELTALGAELVAKVKAAARSTRPRPTVAAPQAPARTPPRPVTDLSRISATEKLLAIGASTGGTEAIRCVLQALPVDAPACVITQHIPPVFSRAFAERMDRLCAIRVCEAGDGQRILPGHAYIAPGDRHLRVIRSGAQYVCRLDDGPLVNRHKPAVGVLFESVARAAGRNAVGILLTGMGDDGAQGLLTLRQAGAATIAQDEASSVVWGMPRAAVQLGAAEQVLPLERIAEAALRLAVSGRRSAPAAG